ncbi:MAG: asparagine synthetase B, partial [Clostridia bacterium]|nr:asparagine synthetase B [Clostridia bacterium]
MHLDAHLWMPFDILSKADKMTMAHSLELRVPYLDLAVFSIAEGCADSLLMRGKTGKSVLRRAAAKVLDGETAYRPKKGFPVPFRS